MRFCLLFALALAACASDPSPAAAPDASPPDAAPDVAVVVDAPVDAAPDVVEVDAGPDVAVVVDAAPEASAPPDAARDAVADVDAADPCGSSALRQCEVEGVPMCVNIRTGRARSDGTTIHCGQCGTTCSADMICAGACVAP